MAKSSGQGQNAGTHKELEQLLQKLLSLESSLDSARTMGFLRKSQFRKRQQFLLLLQSRIAHLNMLVDVDLNPEENAADIGLPCFDRCDASELAHCDRYLTSRLELCKDLYSQLTKLYIQVTEARNGKTGKLLAVMRFWRLKKIIKRLNRQSQHLETKKKSQEHEQTQLTNRVYAKSATRHLAKNLDGLAYLFQDLDGLSQELAQLESSIKKEVRHLDQMREWLFQNGPALAQPQMQKATLVQKKLTANSLEVRIRAARTFVESRIQQNNKDRSHAP